jgi:hypothetical protein
MVCVEDGRIENHSPEAGNGCSDGSVSTTATTVH